MPVTTIRPNCSECKGVAGNTECGICNGFGKRDVTVPYRGVPMVGMSFDEAAALQSAFTNLYNKYQDYDFDNEEDDNESEV